MVTPDSSPAMPEHTAHGDAQHGQASRQRHSLEETLGNPLAWGWVAHHSPGARQQAPETLVTTEAAPNTRFHPEADASPPAASQTNLPAEAADQSALAPSFPGYPTGYGGGGGG